MRKYGLFLGALLLAAPGCRELDERTERAADKAGATVSEARDKAEARLDRREDRTQAAEDRREAAEHRADDSGVNARDRNGALPTPVDQSEKKEDLALVQAIRKAVVADDTLSMNAKNVKIIVVDGKVTLRGPVENVKERDEVVAKATLLAGKDKVEDALDVLNKPAGSKEPTTPQPVHKDHGKTRHQRH